MELHIDSPYLAPESPIKMRTLVHLSCIASAVFILLAYAPMISAQEKQLALKSEAGGNQNSQPVARDFAQAVQVPKAVALGYPKEWYRLVLPIASACFFVSFAIWSLQSVGNQALRPLAMEDEGPYP